MKKYREYNDIPRDLHKDTVLKCPVCGENMVFIEDDLSDGWGFMSGRSFHFEHEDRKYSTCYTSVQIFVPAYGDDIDE